MDQQIEHVARAFYDAAEDGQNWEREPEILKEEFRRYAREAIALLQQPGAPHLEDMDTIELSDAA